MPNKLYQESRELMKGCRVLLEDLDELGVERVPLRDPVASETRIVPDVQPTATQKDSAGKQRESLEDIQRDLVDCRRCQLCAQRTRVVFGVGAPRARLVLVGEAPGAQEDKRGEPFVGEAGALLDRILLAMKLRRDEVYICNVIKCRPPGNRDPEMAEITSCEAFLKRQLAAIEPEFILSLGRFATQTLLKTDAPLGQLRGRWQTYEGIPLMPTYHPAYLLRNPADKRQVWEDVKQVMHRLQESDA